MANLDPILLVGKLDRILGELLKEYPDKSEYIKHMKEHLNSMYILTLLEFGEKVPKLQFGVLQTGVEKSK